MITFDYKEICPTTKEKETNALNEDCVLVRNIHFLSNANLSANVQTIKGGKKSVKNLVKVVKSCFDEKQ